MIALADCAVTVTNASEAARWWKETLGFAIHTVGGTGHAVLVAPPGDRFVLHLCEGFAPVEPGNTGIAFMTDEIDELVRRMTEAGVQFPEPLKKETWGGTAKFADPDGNIYWLVGASGAFVRQEARRTAGDARSEGRRGRATPRSRRRGSPARGRRRS